MLSYELTKRIMNTYGGPLQAFNLIFMKLQSAEPGSDAIILDDNYGTLTTDCSVEILGYLYQIKTEKTMIENYTKQRFYGIYFTEKNLADILVSESLNKLPKEFLPKFLEPSVGLGAFVFSYIRNIWKDKNKQKLFSLQEIVDQIYICDIDTDVINIMKQLIPIYISLKYSEKVFFDSSNALVVNTLFDLKEKRHTNLLELFDCKLGFDLIISNPPYRLLRPNSDDTEAVKNEIKIMIEMASKNKIYADIKGVNNIYKLFVAKILNELLRKEGVVGLLIPKSLLTDNQSTKMRKSMFEKFQVGNIYYLPEGNNFFPGVGQAFSLFSLKSGVPTTDINIYSPDDEGKSDRFYLNTKTCLKVFQLATPHMSIFPFTKNELKFLEALENSPKVKDCIQIVNLRGELDISVDKQYISSDVTPFNFVQGINVGFYTPKSTTKYVTQNFFPRIKERWVKQDRIACHQISNMNQSRRLKWSRIRTGSVVANSCNFIAIDQLNLFRESSPILLSYLLAVFNSDFQNKRFKLLSANNHISNDEISFMPLVIPSLYLQNLIGALAEKLEHSFDIQIFNQIENLLLEIYNIKNFIEDPNLLLRSGE